MRGSRTRQPRVRAGLPAKDQLQAHQQRIHAEHARQRASVREVRQPGAQHRAQRETRQHAAEHVPADGLLAVMGPDRARRGEQHGGQRGRDGQVHGQRRGGRVTAQQVVQHRNQHQPAADAEQAGQEPGRQPGEREPREVHHVENISTAALYALRPIPYSGDILNAAGSCARAYCTDA